MPLPGHTFGHTGVAVQQDSGWLLLAGDAYFHARGMDLPDPACMPGLRVYRWMMEKDHGARLENRQSLRDLRHQHGGQVQLFCSHDVEEFEQLSRRSARLPAEAFAGRRRLGVADGGRGSQKLGAIPDSRPPSERPRLH